MHEPLTIADEEGVRFVNREIIHRLEGVHRVHPLDITVTSVQAAHFVAVLPQAVHPFKGEAAHTEAPLHDVLFVEVRVESVATLAVQRQPLRDIDQILPCLFDGWRLDTGTLEGCRIVVDDHRCKVVGQRVQRTILARLPDRQDVREKAIEREFRGEGQTFAHIEQIAAIIEHITDHIDGDRVIAYLPGWERRYYWQYGDLPSRTSAG